MEDPQFPVGTAERPHPTWQGPPLAFAQLNEFFNLILKSLQPPRPDIIFQAATDGLVVVDLLQQYWEGQPPGSNLARFRKL